MPVILRNRQLVLCASIRECLYPNKYDNNYRISLKLNYKMSFIVDLFPSIIGKLQLRKSLYESFQILVLKIRILIQDIQINVAINKRTITSESYQRTNHKKCRCSSLSKHTSNHIINKTSLEKTISYLTKKQNSGTV